MTRILETLFAAALLAAPSSIAQTPDGPVAGGPPVVVVHPSPQSGPVRVSGGVMAGRILTKVQPVYPAEARIQHISGSVVLRAIISKAGTIESLQAISGPDALKAAAIDAVRQWTYQPFLLNSEPVEVDTTVTLNFYLTIEPPPLL